MQLRINPATRLYPIVSTPQQMLGLLELGYQWIQIRVKTEGKSALAPFISAFKAFQRDQSVLREVGPKIILNDRPDWAVELGFDGFHLGQEDLDRFQTRLKNFISAETIWGISTHNPKEIRRALELKPTYLAFGPIFSTAVKPNLSAAGHFEELSHLCRNSTVPVVAIGGISAENIPIILSQGAERCAFIGLTDRILSEHLPPAALLSSVSV